uniref:J domain-containing protein n=1 Tax=Bionectria ochroleuca TaxID=29856 RepID=A0A0B7KSI4_BIOOC
MAAGVTIDYYAVLQVHVSPTADRHTIWSSYMRLAKQYHPDKNASDPKSTALFQLTDSTSKLETAYSVIYDIEKQRDYDHQRKTMIPSISTEDF